MNHYYRSVALIVIGGLFLSTLGIGMRFIESASSMQITFYRAIFQLILMVLALVAYSAYNKSKSNKENSELTTIVIGWKELRSGFCFSIASVFLVLAINNTSVANTMLIVSLAPLFSGVLAWLLLKERVSKTTILAIIVAVLGVSIMVGGALDTGGLLGIAYAFCMMLFYSLFTVTLRSNPHGNGLVVSVLGSLLVVLIVLPWVWFQDDFAMTTNDWVICILLGFFQVGLGTLGLILGAKHVPAAQVTLLAMLEVILSPVWVWLGVGEVPTLATMIGGVFIIGAISYQVLQPMLASNWVIPESVRD